MQAPADARERRLGLACDATALLVLGAFAATGLRLLWPIVFIVLVGRSLLLPAGNADALRALIGTAAVSSLLVAHGGALRADLALMPAAALLGVVEAVSARVRDRERRPAVADRRAADRLVAIDPLTGLANRRQLRLALTRRAELETPAGFGVVLLDIDRFKRINDTFGSPAMRCSSRSPGASPRASRGSAGRSSS